MLRDGRVCRGFGCRHGCAFFSTQELLTLVEKAVVLVVGAGIARLTVDIVHQLGVERSPFFFLGVAIAS